MIDPEQEHVVVRTGAWPRVVVECLCGTVCQPDHERGGFAAADGHFIAFGHVPTDVGPCYAQPWVDSDERCGRPPSAHGAGGHQYVSEYPPRRPPDALQPVTASPGRAMAPDVDKDAALRCRMLADPDVPTRPRTAHEIEMAAAVDALGEQDAEDVARRRRESARKRADWLATGTSGKPMSRDTPGSTRQTPSRSTEARRIAKQRERAKRRGELQPPTLHQRKWLGALRLGRRE